MSLGDVLTFVLFIVFTLIFSETRVDSSGSSVRLSWSNGGGDNSSNLKISYNIDLNTNVSSILDKYFIDLKDYLTVPCVSKLENYKYFLETHLIDQKKSPENVNENDLVTELSLDIVKLNTNLRQQQEKISKIMDDLAKAKETYQVFLETKKMLDNKLSASLQRNVILHNQLSDLNDIKCQKPSCEDKKQTPTLSKCSELEKKYTDNLETLIACGNRVLSLTDHQVNLEKNLTTLELKYANTSLQLENKIHQIEMITKDPTAFQTKYACKICYRN